MSFLLEMLTIALFLEANLSAKEMEIVILALLLHYLSSLLFAQIVKQKILSFGDHTKMVKNTWKTALFPFSIAFFIPLVGGLGLYFVLITGQNKIKKTAKKSNEKTNINQISRLKKNNKMNGLTLHDGKKANQTLENLLATRNRQNEQAIPILQKHLEHPAEDVRLLAVSLLEKRESTIYKHIDALETYLSHTQSPVIMHSSLRQHLQLARMYLGLAEMALAKDDMQIQVLENARKHTLFVLKHLSPHHPKAFYLLGQIYLQTNHLKAAEKSFQKAMTMGIANQVIIPRLAEIAYRTKHFSQMRFYLRQLGT